jgi:hypothetical protein
MSIIDKIKNLPSFAKPISEFAKSFWMSGNYKTGEDIALVGNKPEVAPQYYQIVFWSGVNDQIIEQYTDKFDLVFPEKYKEILKYFNGVSVVGLDIFGIPKSILNEPALLDRSSRQCLDISTANQHWIHEYNIDKSLFHFGGRHYSDELNCGFFMSNEGTIFSYLKTGEVVGNWNSLEEFFRSEISATIELGDE